jgi:hypothetical protein
MTLPTKNNYTVNDILKNNSNNNDSNTHNNYTLHSNTIGINTNNNYYAASMLPRRNLLANTQEISIITSLDDLYQLNLASPSPPSSLASSATGIASATTTLKPITTTIVEVAPPPDYFTPDDIDLLLQGGGDSNHANITIKIEESQSPTSSSVKEDENMGANEEENNHNNEEHNLSEGSNTSTCESEGNGVFCDGNGSVDFDNLVDLNNSCEDIGEDVVCNFNSSSDNIYYGGDDELLMLENLKSMDESSEDQPGGSPHPQQLIIQYVLRHPLLPHFQRVIVYLKKNGFLTNIGDEDVRAQQQYMQSNFRGLSVERFLQSYDVAIPVVPPEGSASDDEMMRKIYQLKKAYDEELVNMDNACLAFVNRMKMLQLEHSKIVPVSEQQIIAKAFLIQNKFGYLRKQLKANICNAMLTVLTPKLTKLKALASTTTAAAAASTSTTATAPTATLHTADTYSTTYYNRKYNFNLRNSCDTFSYASIKTEEEEEEEDKTDVDDDENYDSADDNQTSTAAARHGEGKFKIGGNISRAKLKMRDLRKKKKKALSRTATEVLSKWFNDHIKDPYPSENEKKTMASTLGLHINQVNNWFGNKR